MTLKPSNIHKALKLNWTLCTIYTKKKIKSGSEGRTKSGRRIIDRGSSLGGLRGCKEIMIMIIII